MRVRDQERLGSVAAIGKAFADALLIQADHCFSGDEILTAMEGLDQRQRCHQPLQPEIRLVRHVRTPVQDKERARRRLGLPTHDADVTCGSVLDVKVDPQIRPEPLVGKLVGEVDLTGDQRRLEQLSEEGLVAGQTVAMLLHLGRDGAPGRCHLA
jgi:hypothetical protein